MTPENFVYWLRGFLEIQEPDHISEKQIQIINDHLDLVFRTVTPDRTTKVYGLSGLKGYELLDTKFAGSSADLLC